MANVETLRNAGIQIWMLTGDKIETAKCIAIAAGFKSRRMQILELKEIKEKKLIEESLSILEQKT